MNELIASAPNFDFAKTALIKKLRALDLNALNLSDYSRNYLSFLIDDAWETLSRFEQVVMQALRHSNNPISEITIVDFGGGTGLQSLLAKEVGFKSVIYNDIFEGSCLDVAVLADACDLQIERIIQGDTTDLVFELNQNLIKADLIVSYDVIEHVYDVKENFLAFAQLNHRPDVIVYGSGANIRNPFYTQAVKKVQISVETVDRNESYGHKASDSLKSYVNLRRDIIVNCAPSLSESEIDYLAIKSRGLIKLDIEKYVKEYLLTGHFNHQISHPTNTCDPMTGNWCEHLLEFDWIVATAESLDFNAQISKGRYSPDRITKRNLARWIFNIVNVSTGRLGFAFSPFYILTLKSTEEKLR
jgi:2-polyprenyl-3-methyl-5-hydroxy-6-metoxy-1,4-benzoquinol methylase